MANELDKLFLQIDPKGAVLDVGCWGFQQLKKATQLGCNTLRHSGVDYCEMSDPIPEGFVFHKADLSQEPIPFEDDSFDLVIASHILEHIPKPIDFFGECVRVCKPGGFIYIEAPSERSLLLPGMPFEREKFFSLSFYDDPTHLSRPWSPQSYYRLTKYYSCTPIKVDYITSFGHRILFPFRLIYALVTKNGKLLELSCRGAIGWASYLIAQKPVNIKGKPLFNYYIPLDR